MYEVLMPVDSSESRGVAQANAVLAMPNASEEIKVTLLYVFDEDASMLEASIEAAEDLEETSPEQIAGGRAAANRLEEGGVAIGHMSRYGEPAPEIVAAGEELDADCLILGGRKRSRIFASVSQEVVLDTDRPVMITGGEK